MCASALFLVDRLSWFVVTRFKSAVAAEISSLCRTRVVRLSVKVTSITYCVILLLYDYTQET